MSETTVELSPRNVWDLCLNESFKAVPGLHSTIFIRTLHAYEDISGVSGGKAKC